ncbi:uncharacterized protein LOC111296663 isoform X2 [Durio zibethinus]|uniref:Uncharacterized protein LOC111296663 isoform X2 n=1 Tax=Durio zibethinus TaxID=66656 RepID=A0A6P5Z2M0_DURZI|nr:uncharacterized protein LOC111296663 isoform X2 [Durio zibethinus]
MFSVTRSRHHASKSLIPKNFTVHKRFFSKSLLSTSDMALGSSSFTSSRLTSLTFPSEKAFKISKNPLPLSSASVKLFCVQASVTNSTPKARFVGRRKESVSVRQLKRPLIEYMSLPASQYSVLDAERIERIDDNTFRCYVYRFKFFNFEVCPVLLVRVEEQPNGCCIKLLSCKLEGSPIVVAQNDKFDASMMNKISCDTNRSNSFVQELTSDAVIEVNIEVPFAFRPIPLGLIESTGTQVLEQILRLMLPRFMAQLVKDYQAWASGDTSRQALGTGEI